MAGVFGAGVVAGTVNTVVGSGSLLTFPTLLAFGFSPKVANVSNTIGLVPGAISGAVGYRRELTGQAHRVRRLGAIALAGGLSGAVLLLALPGSAFEKVVPFLVLIAVVLVIVQPKLAAKVAARRAAQSAPKAREPVLDTGVFLTAIYGGYFGAAQGVILIALLGIFVDDHIQRLNGLKNVMGALVNGTGAVLFAIFASVAWLPALLLAVGSTIGGQLGAHYGRRLPPNLLRSIIVVVGLAVTVKLFLDW
jgi:uncharacterized membrane protein YfcA